MSMEEFGLRLEWIGSGCGRTPFPLRTAIGEPFCHPKFLEIMRALRRVAPHETFRFVTNGTHLTHDVVSELAELGPVFLNLSVNSLSPSIRREQFGDLRPEFLIQAPALLRELGIAYTASIVLWPTVPFEDVARTLELLDEQRPVAIRLCLTGHSRWFSEELAFDPEIYWPKAVRFARHQAETLRAPLLFEPHFYVFPTIRPRVAGVVVGSPAQRAGIAAGDLICSVEGQPVHTLTQARTLLNSAQPRRRVELRLDRTADSQPRDVVLRIEPPDQLGYPYRQVADARDFPFGIILSQGLKFTSLALLQEQAERRGARRLLVLTSKVMRPVVEEMLDMVELFSGVEIELEVPENRYFGGSVSMGDLLVVDDFVAAIRAYSRRRRPPDLVAIPSSPFLSSPWMRDLTGTPLFEIERRTGVPVVIVPCQTINF
jgi:NifB/MoaA-like Fe-S oxidoreductase